MRERQSPDSGANGPDQLHLTTDEQMARRSHYHQLLQHEQKEMRYGRRRSGGSNERKRGPRPGKRVERFPEKGVKKDAPGGADWQRRHRRATNDTPGHARYTAARAWEEIHLTAY